MDVCIAAVEVPYDYQSVYDRLNARAAAVDDAVNFKGSKMSVTVCLGLVVGSWVSG